MSKSVLVIDTPKTCWHCHFRGSVEWFGPICIPYDSIHHDELRRHLDMTKDRPEWCPLRPLPEKWEEKPYNSQSRIDWQRGYNYCLDDIQGVEDENELANKWWEEHSSKFD